MFSLIKSIFASVVYVGAILLSNVGLVNVPVHQKPVPAIVERSTPIKVVEAPKEQPQANILSEVDKLKKEIASLKQQKTLAITPQPTSIQAPTPASLLDYKSQALVIWNAAKENHIQLLNYSRECASMVAERKSAIQDLAADRSSFLPRVAFDTNLYSAYKLLYDIYANEIAGMDQYLLYCDVTVPNIITSDINKVNDSIIRIQDSNKPVTIEELTTYQSAYFGATGFDKTRANIKDVIDRANKFIATSNSQYRQLMATIGAYIDRATVPVAQPTVQYALPAPILPQMPQTTRCTISGDGVGLQAYVTCTTSSF